METLSTGSGNWLLEEQPKTGSTASMVIVNVVLAASIFFAPGTCAFAQSIDNLRPQHICKSKSFVCSPEPVFFEDILLERSPSENIARIKEILAPAVSDLAKCFNVSRQTVYNWLNGEQPTEGNLEKLNDVALAADIIAESGLKITGIQLNRKIHKGNNFFEAVRDGGLAQEAANLLVRTLQTEQHQREMLAKRFVGRLTDRTFSGGDLSPVCKEV